MKTVFEVPNHAVSSTDIFETMFAWRKILIEAYIKANKLPEYPLKSLAMRDNQNFLRELISFCEEEIYEAYNEMVTLATGLETQLEKKVLMPTLHAYNEELSDVTHFILEILVYLNIEYEDVDAYYGKLLKEKGLERFYASTSVLANALSYANYANIQEGYKSQMIRMSQYKIMRDDEVQSVFEQAGRSISTSTLQEHQVILFQVMNYLNKIKCLLKSKYWKDSDGAVPNMELVHNYAMEAFLYWMCYLDFVGATEKSISQTYYKKHVVNLDRLENGW